MCTFRCVSVCYFVEKVCLWIEIVVLLVGITWKQKFCLHVIFSCVHTFTYFSYHFDEFQNYYFVKKKKKSSN